MRVRFFLGLALIVLATACQPKPTLVPPTPTPLAVDDLAIYRQALTPAAQNDLATLDHPTRYNLHLKYDPATTTLIGSEDALYYNRENGALSEIFFRLFANYPDSGGKIEITRAQADGETITPTFVTQNTAMRLSLPKLLLPDQSINLHLEFTITVPRSKGGHYNDFVADENVVTLPTVYPLIPAYDSAGWHIELPPAYGDLVYADVSLYAVTITVPSNMVVIGSGSVVGVQDNGDGTSTWALVGAPMRDFDLNLTTRLLKSSAVVDQTVVNAYYNPEDTDAGARSLQTATNALKTFIKRFGNYPYRELEVVETPTTAGGIEYPGVIAIASNLYRDSRSQEFFEIAIAHEVSHQWWYAVVGNDQVNDPWVDESLAQYSTVIYFQDTRGEQAAKSMLKGYLLGLYNRAKNEGRDAAVNQPVAAFDESDYASIVYGKGPLFYDAIRPKMGDDKFFAFLQNYYARFRFKIAFPDDILKTAQDTCACNLQPEYQQWILSPAK